MLGSQGVELTVYRKPTNTDVILNFRAVAPASWKAGLILCMLHRARKVCSSMLSFDREVDTLRSIFGKNGYPADFFNRVVQKFERITSALTDDSVSVNEDTDKRFIIKLPFVNKASQLFAKRLRLLIDKKFGVKISVVYNSCELSSLFFHSKIRLPIALSAKVVYKFTCLRDVNLTYIGETTRPLVV